MHNEHKSEPKLRCYVHREHIKDIPLVNEMRIGRGEPEQDTDIQIEHPVLSRIHGKFFEEDGQWCYRDLDSSNGSYLNGQMLKDVCQLKPGDRISFCIKGNLNPLVELEFTHSESVLNKNTLENDTENVQEHRRENQKSHTSGHNSYVGRKRLDSETMQNANNALEIAIRKREASIGRQKKTLLKDIHLTVMPGEMTLILGGSGAGKTTFVNAVMGYEKADGTIRYGKMDVYADYEKMKYEIGFVPQKDLLRDADTVYDTLYNAVQMKMLEEMSEPEHRRRVEEIIELLGLDKQKDTLVKKLSGGQRKRLSIAMEFAGDPQLFFLDEPDSGLDGIMARTLMEKLREIADMGKIVMVITHAPDRVAELFDKIIVLAKSNTDDVGHLVFHGSVPDAFRFFETDSLEEIVKRINSVSEGGEGRADEFIQKWESRGRIE
ncbi:MAG TPA: ATP-binding cassette domain-containing protein [Lachnospiraceae bacterium]|nr:ATP-binding cassette domain-containing protein [Lachnospiraceae bacterium]